MAEGRSFTRHHIAHSTVHQRPFDGGAGDRGINDKRNTVCVRVFQLCVAHPYIETTWRFVAVSAGAEGQANYPTKNADNKPCFSLKKFNLNIVIVLKLVS